MSLCFCKRLSESVWRVFCVDCGLDIDTMSSNALMTAIAFGAGKGGVKCPSCRKGSCGQCGLPLGPYGDKAEPGKLCTVCELEKDESLDVEKLENVPLGSVAAGCEQCGGMRIKGDEGKSPYWDCTRCKTSRISPMGEHLTRGKK